MICAALFVGIFTGSADQNDSFCLDFSNNVVKSDYYCFYTFSFFKLSTPIMVVLPTLTEIICKKNLEKKDKFQLKNLLSHKKCKIL